MRIYDIKLREVHMHLVAPFETSMSLTTGRRILLVEVNLDGTTGWGECVAGENPFYGPETVETAWQILTTYLWPMVKGKEFVSAADIWPMLEHVRGHNMAKGALEAAVWEAEARQKNMPLAQLIGGIQKHIACGVSIGIKATIEELVEAVKKELAAGYQRIKIKIKPGRDLEEVKALRKQFPQIKLMVDANSAYRLEDWRTLKRLDEFYLMMIEQPLGWDDLFSHIELQRRLDTPICLDECIHTEDQAKAAIDFDACKIINIKLGRVGGYTVAKRIHDLAQQAGIPVWCGGMLESGIGRAHNIALSTLPNFGLPGDVTASKRYWLEDIIEPEVTVTRQGVIHVPTGPGMGFEPRVDLIDKLTVRSERFV
jgi:O-succinylbenzoate synthase